MSTRLRLLFAALILLVVAGSFAEHTTRALLLGSRAPSASFASVGTNSGIGLPAPGLPTSRTARRAIRASRTLQGVPAGDSSGQGVVVPVSPLTSANEGVPGGVGDSAPAPGAAVPRQLALSNPGSGPLVGSAANQVPGTDGPIPPAVPEPPAWALGLIGLVCLGAWRYRAIILQEIRKISARGNTVPDRL